MYKTQLTPPRLNTQDLLEKLNFMGNHGNYTFKPYNCGELSRLMRLHQLAGSKNKNLWILGPADVQDFKSPAKVLFELTDNHGVIVHEVQYINSGKICKDTKYLRKWAGPCLQAGWCIRKRPTWMKE